jgi:Zn-dependent protease
MRPQHLPRLIEVMQIKRVRVFVHWSVLLIGAIILIRAFDDPLQAFTILGGYYGVILLHECGHMIAAQRRGSFVSSIELYPIWGITHFSEPRSRFDQCVIIWGGVLAQALVGVPIVIWIETFGYTRFPHVNTILAIFGYFSFVVAVYNLIPLRPLDGAMAWRLLPSLFKRPTSRSQRHDFERGSWR